MQTLTRPHSRWRIAARSLLVVAWALLLLAVVLDTVWLRSSSVARAVAAVGLLLAAGACLMPKRLPRWPALAAMGVAAVAAVTANPLAVFSLVVWLLVLVGQVGGRQGLLIWAVFAGALWGTFGVGLLTHDERFGAGTFFDLVLVSVLLLVGWYMGRLVHRTEQMADELWVAHRQLEASMATQRELVLAEERARAAQELHDGLGHHLTVMRLSLDFAERVRERDPERAWREVQNASRTGAQALAEMRAWVRAMKPPSVEGGLATMLDQLAESFRSTGLVVQVSHAGDDRPLPEPVALLVTRVVQESLTNVLKHSNGTTVRVDARTGDELALAVTDDGTAAPSEVREGFGLGSLRSRAEALGGECRVDRTPAGGWKVAVRVPLTTMSTFEEER